MAEGRGAAPQDGRRPGRAGGHSGQRPRPWGPGAPGAVELRGPGGPTGGAGGRRSTEHSLPPAVPTPRPLHTLKHTSTHALPHPTHAVDPAGLNSESQEEGETRGVWPLGAEPWPLAPEGRVGSPRASSECREMHAPCRRPPAPAPGHRGPQALAPPRAGSGAHSLETNLADIKRSPGTFLATRSPVD